MNKKLVPAFLTLCLFGGSLTLALEAPAAPVSVKGTGDDAGRRIAAETAASIAALGDNPATRQISSIVFKAVRSSPDKVLVIVDAASRVAPPSAVPEIVTSATAAVPNPWKQVTYRRESDRRSEPDYKGGPEGRLARGGSGDMDLGGREAGATGGRGSQGASGRSAANPGSNAAGGVQSAGGNLANSFVSTSIFWNSGNLGTGGTGQFVFGPFVDGNAANGSSMTLAEAIAITAFQAQPGLSFSALTAAVDIALRTDPAVLLGNIQSARAVSGVGDAGLSNYANEPLRTPNQPAVSR